MRRLCSWKWRKRAGSYEEAVKVYLIRFIADLPLTMRGVGSEVGVAGAYKMKYLLLFVVLSWTVIATPLPFIANKLEEPATLTILREAAISKV